jgi:hypothetical protein
MVPAMDQPKSSSLVALSDRREQVIEWLSDQFARDVLEMDEYERRIDLVHQATSVATLNELMADLDMPAVDPVAPGEALVPRPAEQLPVPRAARKRVIAIMGGVERKGRWVVPQNVRVTAIMGGISLDFREALLAPGVTQVHVTTIMGGVEIIVPPHVAVQCDGLAIMGGFEEVHRAPVVPDPDRPTLMITGLAVMGGVEITTRLPGESGWQAWKRERRERRQLQEAPGKQLGPGQ